MKKLLGIVVLACLGCSESHELVIKGTIDSDEPLKIIRYIPDSNNQPRPYDTVPSVEGKFLFKVAVEKPNINFITVEGKNGSFPFIAEKGSLTMAIKSENIANSKTSGSLSNDDYMAFKDQSEAYGVQLQQLTEEINEARQYNDNLLVEELQRQTNQVRQEISSYEQGFITDKTDSYLSVLLLDRMLNSKTLSPAQVKPIFTTYSERIQQSVIGQGIQSRLNAPISPTDIGSKAPNFTAPNPEGSPLELQKQLGKITILDFWASWCRPCRIENPNLVRTYNKLKDKGLHVVSVSLDRDKKRWLQAIKDDGLNWDHVSNLKYWRDPVAQLYKVSSIPATFILDENGFIIAKNLRGPQLEATLTKLMQ